MSFFSNLNLQAVFPNSFAIDQFTLDCLVGQNGVSALQSSLIAIPVGSLR